MHKSEWLISEISNKKDVRYIYNKCIVFFYFIPIVNIPYFFLFGKYHHKDAMGPTLRSGMFSMILSLLMTYPLYLLNLAYLLEVHTYDNYKDISIYNICQLLFSLISLSLSPFFNFVTMVNKSYIENSGLILSLHDKFKVYFWISLYFVPLMVIEIIHFFPALFAYYLDNTINKEQLGIVLIAFNAPKIIFILHMVRKLLKHRASDADFRVNQRSLFVVVVYILITFVTLPLIPYVLMMFEKHQYKHKMTINRIQIDETDVKQEEETQEEKGCCASIPAFPIGRETFLKITQFKGDDDDIRNTDEKNRNSGDGDNEMNTNVSWLKKLKQRSIFFKGWNNSLTKYYYNVILYLWLGYMGSSMLLVYFSTNDLNKPDLSNFVKSLIEILFYLCVFITVIMPFAWFKVNLYAPFGMIE